LNPVRDAELPVVSAARTRLIRHGQAYRLLITGAQPIAEPVFMISLRAGCGVADLQRDYVLMPEAPLMPGESGNHLPTAAVDSNFDPKPAKRRESAASDADLQPELAEPTARPRRAPSNNAPATPRPKKTIQRDTLAELGMKGGDRVLLSAEPEALKPGERAIAPRSELNEMDVRMLKLETTLHSLNQQVEKLNTALEVADEAIALRQKLQLAQAQLAGIDSDMTINAKTASSRTPQNPTMGNWLELLPRALAGGGMAGGIAHLLSRRRASQSDDAGAIERTALHPKARHLD